MELINEYALSPLDPADVFAFKVTMCANEVDRDHEMFPLKTLQELSEMFVGKTVVKDHVHKSDNQIARIYQTYLSQDASSITKAGEIYTQLVAKCYMVKTASNADLIAEVNAGIRKEVSLGCRVTKAVCSVCGTDNTKSYCKHFPGQIYEEKSCFFKLEGASDAYELSFVAIPAQREAGTVKSYGEEPIYRKESPSENDDAAKRALDRAISQADGENGEQTDQAPASDAGNSELSAPDAPEIQGGGGGVEALTRDVAALISKMDAFIDAVSQAKSQMRGHAAAQIEQQTADFADAAQIAQEIEDMQASVGQEDPLEGGSDPDGGDSAPDGTRVAPENAPIPSENDDSQGDQAQDGQPDPHAPGELTDSGDDVPPSGGDDSAAVPDDTPDGAYFQQMEKLAALRLRSLDLSLSLLGKAN